MQENSIKRNSQHNKEKDKKKMIKKKIKKKGAHTNILRQRDSKSEKKIFQIKYTLTFIYIS